MGEVAPKSEAAELIRFVLAYVVMMKEKSSKTKRILEISLSIFDTRAGTFSGRMSGDMFSSFFKNNCETIVHCSNHISSSAVICTPGLVRQLADPSPRVRHAALNCVGQFSADLAPVLQLESADVGTEVRWNQSNVRAWTGHPEKSEYLQSSCIVRSTRLIMFRVECRMFVLVFVPKK